MKRFKILVINHESIYPPSGGGKLCMFTSLKLLAEAGHKVTHLSWGGEEAFYGYKQGIELIHIKIASLQGIYRNVMQGLRDVGSFLNISRLLRLQDKGISFGKVKDILENRKFDIIIHEGPDASALPSMLSKLYNAPYIERIYWVGAPRTLHNIRQWENYSGIRLSQYFKPIYLGKLVTKKIIEVKQKRLLRKADYIITVSRKDEEIIKSWGFYNVSTCIPPCEPPSGVSNGIINLPGKPPYIVFAGPLDQKVNLFSAFFLIKLARHTKSASFLVLGGDRNFFRDVSLPQNFIPLGQVSPLSLKFILSKASIIVIPQVLASGVQTKVIEALSYGKPVVTTSVIAEEFDNVVNYKHIIVEDNPLNWKKVIEYLIENEDFRKKLSEGAKEYYSRFLSPRVHAQKLEYILSGIYHAQLKGT